MIALARTTLARRVELRIAVLLRFVVVEVPPAGGVAERAVDRRSFWYFLFAV